jgi:hypothetical protein
MLCKQNLDNWGELSIHSVTHWTKIIQVILGTWSASWLPLHPILSSSPHSLVSRAAHFGLSSEGIPHCTEHGGGQFDPHLAISRH